MHRFNTLSAFSGAVRDSIRAVSLTKPISMTNIQVAAEFRARFTARGQVKMVWPTFLYTTQLLSLLHYV